MSLEAKANSQHLKLKIKMLNF